MTEVNQIKSIKAAVDAGPCNGPSVRCASLCARGWGEMVDDLGICSLVEE